jgi:hypothetical protein
MRNQRLDAYFTTGLLVLGMWIIWQSIGYGVIGPDITGAGFFPIMAGCLLTISAAGALLRQRREARNADAITAPELFAVGGTIAATAVFLLCIETFGMVFLTPLYVAAVSLFIEKPPTWRRGAIVAAVAVGFSAFAYILFDYFLNVPLPHGFSGI